MNRIIKILPSIALLLAIFGGPALGEGIITGGISGSTVDQTEAVIPGASIKVVSESSSKSPTYPWAHTFLGLPPAVLVRRR